MLKLLSPKGNRRFNASFKNNEQAELIINSEPALTAGRQHVTIKKR